MNEEDFKKNPRSALLFEAADLLGRRAERCVPGPWVANGRDVEPEDDEWADIALNCPSHDESDWIAMMDPTIAPHLVSVFRVQAANLYLDEVSGGDTPAMREYVTSTYGDLLQLAAKLLNRDASWLGTEAPTT